MVASNRRKVHFWLWGLSLLSLPPFLCSGFLPWSQNMNVGWVFVISMESWEGQIYPRLIGAKTKNDSYISVLQLFFAWAKGTCPEAKRLWSCSGEASHISRIMNCWHIHDLEHVTTSSTPPHVSPFDGKSVLKPWSPPDSVVPPSLSLRSNPVWLDSAAKSFNG